MPRKLDLTCDTCGKELYSHAYKQYSQMDWVREKKVEHDGRLGYYFECAYPAKCEENKSKKS